MPQNRSVTVQTLGLLVGVAALECWVFVQLTSSRVAAWPPLAAGVLLADVTVSGVVIGLACRRGRDRTLAHVGVTAVLALGLLRLILASDLFAGFVALGCGITLATVSMALLLEPKHREHRSTWWWEGIATIAAAIASLTLGSVALAVLVAILLMISPID